MNFRIKITIIFAVFISTLFCSRDVFAATEFVSIIDPDSGTGTDFISLNNWESTIDSDLTAVNSQVFSGTRTGTMTDTTTVYLCRGGAYQTHYGTLTHASSTQAYIISITGSATETSGDIWYTNSTCNSATYFTISDGGDSAIAVASCRSSNGTSDTTAVYITGWTTSETNYIKIWTDPSAGNRHSGKWDDYKYNITVASDAGFRISEEFVYIEGIQVYITAATSVDDSAIWINAPATGWKIYISECILRGAGSAPYWHVGVESYATTVGTAYVSNCVAYDFKSSVAGAGYLIDASGAGGNGSTMYVYNSTVHNSTSGFHRYDTDVFMDVKNSIVQDGTTFGFRGTHDSTSSTSNITYQNAADGGFGVSADSGTTTSYSASKLIETGQNFLTTVKVGMIVKDSGTSYSYVTAIDSDSQLSIADSIMSSGETYTIYTNIYSTTVSFVDENNDDFHLAPTERVARDAGTDLSSDANFPFSDDIDGDTRDINSAWDIGADEAQISIYRSVGPSATAALDDDNSNAVTITISGGTATFSSAVENNVGVGDAVVYDSDSDNDLDASDSIAFIMHRTDSTHYILQTDAGDVPGDLSANDKWAIYRAYTRLSYAESGTKNTSIPMTFIGGNRDLVTNNEQWNIATYANGTTADTNGVSVSDWTTGERNYLKIYTPVSASEVGTSQRHSGKLDSSKYKLEVTSNTGLYITDSYVRVDGLQINIISSDSNYDNGISVGDEPSNDIRISNNIINGNKSGTSNYGYGIWLTWESTNNGRYAYIWNNIITNWRNGAYTEQMGIRVNDNWTKVYASNNTFYNSYYGFYGAGSAGILKNNIAQDCYDGFNPYSGSFDSSSDYNISDISSDAPNASFAGGYATVPFLDENNNDFHLATPNNPAINAGTDLSSDANLHFSTDIDGESRPMDASWDIGADEYSAQIKTKFQGTIKFKGDIKIE